MREKNNNAVIIINSLSCGGAEKVCSTLAKETEGIICIYKIIPSKNHFNVGKTTTINLGFYNGSFFFFKAVNVLFAFIRFQYYLIKERPTVIISFLHISHFFSYFSFFSMSKIKRVYSERSLIECEYSGIRLKIISFIIKYIFNNKKKSDSIISISKRVELSLEKIGVNLSNNFIIYNPIRCINQNMFLSSNPNLDKQLKLFTVSRLHETKNITFLIKCAEKLKLRYSNLSLDIVGVGPERANLEILVKQLDLKSNVNFTGFLSKPFEPLYKGGIFVYASRHESFGNVCLEAASYGVPVLLPDSSGAVEEVFSLSNNSGAKFYKNNNIDSFVHEINQILSFGVVKELSERLHNYSFLFNEDQVISHYQRIIFED